MIRRFMGRMGRNKMMIVGIVMLIVLGIGLVWCMDAYSQQTKIEEPHAEKNGIYFWKTQFYLDSTSIAFLKKHKIDRVYLRMFDVTEEPNMPDTLRAVPNATVIVTNNFDPEYQYGEDMSYLEIVPTVFITLDALRAMKGNEDILARNIAERVSNMVSYNSLPQVGELQLDCDWTPSTELQFFELCKKVKENLKNMGLPWKLSATIRLHQLAKQAPPVDRGVLMVYNTGNFDDPDAKNSIIDAEDVKPYMKYLSGYPLHIDVAYPTYSWQLLFHGRKFIGLMNGVDVENVNKFEKKSEGIYVAKHNIPYNSGIIRTGDIVRVETSTFEDVAAVKRMIDTHLSGKTYSNILYQFDMKNLSKYSSDEIEQLYSTGR